jgi:hypothetical protein
MVFATINNNQEQRPLLFFSAKNQNQTRARWSVKLVASIIFGFFSIFSNSNVPNLVTLKPVYYLIKDTPTKRGGHF